MSGEYGFEISLQEGSSAESLIEALHKRDKTVIAMVITTSEQSITKTVEHEILILPAKEVGLDSLEMARGLAFLMGSLLKNASFIENVMIHAIFSETIDQVLNDGYEKL